MFLHVIKLFAESQSEDSPEVFTSVTGEAENAHHYTMVGEESALRTLYRTLEMRLDDANLLLDWFNRRIASEEVLEPSKQLSTVRYELVEDFENRQPSFHLLVYLGEYSLRRADPLAYIHLLYETLICRANIALQSSPSVSFCEEFYVTMSDKTTKRGLIPKSTLVIAPLASSGETVLYAA